MVVLLLIAHDEKPNSLSTFFLFFLSLVMIDYFFVTLSAVEGSFLLSGLVAINWIPVYARMTSLFNF